MKHKIIHLELEIMCKGRKYFLIFSNFKYEEIKV